MANPAQGYNAGEVGIGVESTWAAPVARTKKVIYNTESLGKSIEKKNTNEVRDTFKKAFDSYNGAESIEGDIVCDIRYEGYELLLANMMPDTTTVETASFVISVTNKFFDFKEDAGVALVGTVAEATYPIGTSDTVIGSLCEAIKTALEATGSGTYSVTYSTATKLVTIAVSGAVALVQFLWQTGVNAANNMGTTIGFNVTADGADAASDVSDNTVKSVNLHTFKFGTGNVQTGVGLTLEKLMSAHLTTGKSFLYNGVKINSVSFNVEPASQMEGTFGIIAKDETALDVETISGLSEVLANLILTRNITTTYDGSPICMKNFSFEVNLGLGTERLCVGDNNLKEPLPTGKKEVTGSLTVEFIDKNFYQDFIANTKKALVITATGPIIQGTEPYKFILTMPNVQLDGTTPQIQDVGIIDVEVPYMALGEDSSNLEATIQIQNTISTII